MELTGDEVCAIVKACGESGVSRLCFGPLDVQFKGSLDNPQEHQSIVVTDPALQDEVTAVETERDEIAHKEDELAQLEIENPAEFERRMLAGDLINSKDAGDDGENDRGPE
jgi:hypothetical protein